MTRRIRAFGQLAEIPTDTFPTMNRCVAMLITMSLLGGAVSCGSTHSVPCQAQATSTDTTIPSRAPHLSTPTVVACEGSPG